MRVFLALVIVAGFLAAGCTSPETVDKGVGVYTFQKDRVDQKLQGNQGYLEGKAPAASSQRKTTRTIIGIDIELPGTEPAAVESKKVQPKKSRSEKPVQVKKEAPKEKTVEKPRGKEVEVRKKEIKDDDFIK